MTIALSAVSASLTVGASTFPLSVKAGTVTLDEGWAPYAQSRVTLAMPPQSTLDALDPRSNPRITVTATRQVPAFGLDQSRTFDLGLRSRDIDHVAAEVTVSLTSDEASLQDYARVLPTIGREALPYQSSLRSLVNNVVLSKIGAALAAGTADGDFTTLTTVTNMVTNPGAETGLAQAGAVNTAVTQDAAWAALGTKSFKLVNGTSEGFLSIGPGDTGALRLGMQAGKTYTFAGTIRLAAVQAGTIGTRPRSVYLGFKNAAGAYVETNTQALNVVGVQRVAVTVAIPLGATEAFVRVYNGSTVGTVWWDALMLTEGDGKDTGGNLLAPFDGDTADTSHYIYDWTGAPGGSTSTRTPVFQRDPQTLEWPPGENAWDFIRPVLDQAGLRLFCDEHRVWRLVDSTFTVPGRVTVAQGFNAYAATDTISRDAAGDDGSPIWFDAVVLKYTWNDSANTAQTAYDIAQIGPTPTRVLSREIQRPFPGPGAAAYILKRANGRGRTLSLTAAVDFTTTPGMVASATLPFTPVQTGYLSSVTWDFGADEMQISTRGLTDTQPSAWVYLAPGERWIDSPVGASWIAESV